MSRLNSTDWAESAGTNNNAASGYPPVHEAHIIRSGRSTQACKNAGPSCESPATIRRSELEPQNQLPRPRRRIRVVLAVARDLRVVDEAETARQQSVRARGRRRGIARAGVRERFQAVEDVEELRPDADARALVNPEGLPQAHRFGRPALAAEIVVIRSRGAPNTRRLIHPGRRIEDRLLRRVDAAAVRVLQVERLSGNAELPRAPGPADTCRGCCWSRGAPSSAPLVYCRTAPMFQSASSGLVQRLRPAKPCGGNRVVDAGGQNVRQAAGCEALEAAAVEDVAGAFEIVEVLRERVGRR